MARKTLALAGIALLGSALLAGCAASGQGSPPTQAHGKVKGSGASSLNLTGLYSNWVMPNRLPVSNKTLYQREVWPIYNAQLPMNALPTSWHGADRINAWKLPPGWIPYLYKNEKHGGVGSSNPFTLYITLQGTVFLFPRTSTQTQWPASRTIGDIPPTTIVAEFVPLKPAVEAGVIPESARQPVTSGYVPTVWEKALGLTSSEIQDAVYGRSP